MAVKDYPIRFPIEMGGMETAARLAMVYPKATTATNVRWGLLGELQGRGGQVRYNTTAMPAPTQNITGLFQFNRRDTTTRYKIVCTGARIMSLPTSGAWTVLASGLTATNTDYWDAAVFNNEMILTNGVDAPQVTDGTAAGTGALTNAAAVQARTAMTTAQTAWVGLHRLRPGTLVTAEGASAAGSFDGITQAYDTLGDAWKTMTRANVNRDEAAGFLSYLRMYTVGGNITGPALTATGESYSLAMDAWATMTNVTVALREAVGAAANTGGYIQTGNNAASGGGWVTTNYRYDPATDTWVTRTAITSTARRQAAGLVMSETTHVISGRTTAGPDNQVTTHDEYSAFADAWTSVGAITAYRRNAAGAKGYDNLGYVAGGEDSVPAESNVIRSYNRVTNAWTASAATLGTARQGLAATADDWWMYLAGGAVGANASAVTERLNTSPAAPVALYVESYRGTLFLARTSSFPSRVFYSYPGNSRTWDPFRYFDVNPDDGQWITGLFVYNGKLYVSKADTIYEVYGNVFDPGDKGDFGYVPLQNVVGTVSNRSIVVTDKFVYYLAKDGLRVFDGARSVKISNELETTLTGYVASRNQYVQGVWWRNRQEILWTFTSAGTTFDTVVSYNEQFKRFSTWTGHTPECLSKTEDANNVDQLLLGGTDGLVNTCDSGTQDLGANFTRTYTTGFFAPAGAFMDQSPGYLYVHANRTAGGTITFDFYRNFNTTTSNQTEAVALDATGSYFLDAATDVRALVKLNVKNQGHHVQVRVTATTDFVLQGMLYLCRPAELSTLPGG